MLYLEITEKPTWEAFFHQLPFTTQQQSWAYGEAIEETSGFQAKRFFVVHQKKTIGCFQVFQRTFLFGWLTLSKMQRGPLWREVPHQKAFQAEFLKILCKKYHHPPLHQVSFLLEETDQHAATFNQILRLMPFGTPYETSLLTLEAPLEDLRAKLHPKWRNKLTKAQKEGILKVTEESSYSALEALFKKFRKQKWQKRFKGPTFAFLTAYFSKEAYLHLQSIEISTSHVVSEALFALHGTTATYMIGWTNSRGRQLNSMNFLMWSALETLKSRGLSVLDLGGTNFKNTGIGTFKKGLGGTPLVLAPTYIG